MEELENKADNSELTVAECGCCRTRLYIPKTQSKEDSSPRNSKFFIGPDGNVYCNRFHYEQFTKGKGEDNLTL